MTIVLNLLWTTVPLLLLSTECGAVTVLSVGLQSGDATLPLHAQKQAVLECRYRLDQGESLEELVWVREGRLLHSSNETQQPGVNVSALYALPNPDRNSTGVYRCTVRTAQGTNATGKFELFVIDIVSNMYYAKVYYKKCAFEISYKTHYAYPRGSAFCGIWVPDSQTGGGAWLEPPPQRVASDATGASFVSSTSASKLSYSSESGEFNETKDAEGRIQFEIMDKQIRVIDTPRNSSVMCTFGYYSHTGRYYPASSFESKSHTHYNSSCLEEVPRKYISHCVTLEFSAYIHDCYDRIHSSMPSKDLTATLRCKKSLESKVLVCKDDVWQLQKDGMLVKDYTASLNEFVNSCETQSPTDKDPDDIDCDNDGNDDDNSGSTAVLSLALAAMALAASLQRSCGLEWA